MGDIKDSILAKGFIYIFLTLSSTCLSPGVLLHLRGAATPLFTSYQMKCNFRLHVPISKNDRKKIFQYNQEQIGNQCLRSMLKYQRNRDVSSFLFFQIHFINKNDLWTSDIHPKQETCPLVTQNVWRLG